jgi:hypothetical protein
VWHKNKKYRGYLFADLMVAFAVLAFLFAGFAVSLDGFRRFNHYQLVRQRCVAAAQAELDSIAVTGEPVGEEDFERLWPEMSVSIEKSDGVGQWEGLKLVKVKTNARSFRRNVEVELSRYILIKGAN